MRAPAALLSAALFAGLLTACGADAEPAVTRTGEIGRAANGLLEPVAATPTATATATAKAEPTTTESDPIATSAEPKPQPPTNEPDGSTTQTAKALEYSGPKLGGGTLDLRVYAGKPVIMYFWAPWCGLCTYTGPYLKRFHDAYGSKAGVIGVGGLDNSGNTLLGYQRDYNLQNVPMFDDHTGVTFKHFGVSSQDVWIYIDAQGNLTKHPGAEPQDAERWLKSQL